MGSIERGANSHPPKRTGRARATWPIESAQTGVDSGTEQTSHGTTGIAATYVVDTDGVVRYEQVAEDVTDRTYGNFVRYYVRDDYGDPFENPF